MRMSANLGARRAFPRLVPRAPAPLFYRPALALAIRGMADAPRAKANDIPKDPSGVFNSAREELKNVGGDLAKTISGNVSREPPIDTGDVASVTREVGGSSKATHGAGLKEDFVSITKDIALTVPDPAMKVGLAGGLPYVGTALASVYYSRQAAQAIAAGADPAAALQLLSQYQHIQVTYGAVLLGFLGAVHWGLEFAKFGGEQGYKRLALGVAPALYAWPTLALTPDVALAAQWAGFTALWYADSKATAAGWTPKWYSQYRFYLSILVGGCIIGTLLGANVLGPASDTSTDYTKLRRLDRLPERSSVGGVTSEGGRKEGTLDSSKTEGIEAVAGDEAADAYVIIKKVDQPEEDRNKQSDKFESQMKDPSKQEEQAQKDRDQQKGKAGKVRSGEGTK